VSIGALSGQEIVVNCLISLLIENYHLNSPRDPVQIGGGLEEQGRSRGTGY